MKIRTDFVTNSSSSNFIIARKVMDPAVLAENTELTKYITAVNLLLLTDNDHDETTESSIFNTKEEYEVSFLERYS